MVIPTSSLLGSPDGSRVFFVRAIYWPTSLCGGWWIQVYPYEERRGLKFESKTELHDGLHLMALWRAIKESGAEVPEPGYGHGIEKSTDRNGFCRGVAIHFPEGLFVTARDEYLLNSKICDRPRPHLVEAKA